MAAAVAASPSVKAVSALGQGLVVSVVEGADEALEETLDLGFRQRAHEAIDRLAALKRINRGHGADTEPACDLRMGVDVHRDQLDLAGRGLRGAFKGSLHGAAGFASDRQEMDEDRLACGFRDDICREVGCRRRLCGRRRRKVHLRGQVRHESSFPLDVAAKMGRTAPKRNLNAVVDRWLSVRARSRVRISRLRMRAEPVSIGRKSEAKLRYGVLRGTLERIPETGNLPSSAKPRNRQC